MKKFVVKLNLNDKDVPQKVEFGQHVHDNMDGNADFTSPLPTLVELQKATDELDSAYTDALGGSHLAQATLRAKDEAFDNVMTAMGNYVDSVARGSEEIIKGAGMETKRQNTPIGLPAKVADVVGKQGQKSGEIDFRWGRVHGSHAYLGYLKADGAEDNQYKLVIKCTRTRFTVGGLTPGVKYWLVLEAIGSDGSGALSDPIISYAAL